MSLCASYRRHGPSLLQPVEAPHLLIVDIGQDTRNDLQQENDEEQDEVLEGRNNGTGVEPHPKGPSVRTPSSKFKFEAAWLPICLAKGVPSLKPRQAGGSHHHPSTAGPPCSDTFPVRAPKPVPGGQ